VLPKSKLPEHDLKSTLPSSERFISPFAKEPSGSWPMMQGKVTEGLFKGLFAC